MKKLFTLCVCAIMGTLTIFAQDIIVTTDAKKIEAKILEVSKSAIKYKEKDNLDGPSYILELSEISSIIYANGKVEIFDNQPANTTSTSVADPNSVEILLLSGNTIKAQITEMKSDYIAYVADGKPCTLPASQIDQVTFLQNGQVKKYNQNSVGNSNTNITHKEKFGACYQGYIDVTGGVGKKNYLTLGGVGLDFINGIRFNKYVSSGIGAGLHSLIFDYQGVACGALQTPLFVDIRAYIPTKKDGLYPYFETSIGPMFRYYQFASGLEKVASINEIATFAFFRLNAGLDVSHFTFGLGYELIGDANGVDNFFFFKIGARVGRYVK